MFGVWLAVGFCSALAIGISGVGGAIVSVPLFLYLGHYSLKDATVFALITVMVTSLSNWLASRRGTVPSVAIPIAFFAWITAQLTVPFKSGSPDWMIQALFACACSYSIIATWIQKTPSQSPKDVHSKKHFFRNVFRYAYLGAILGFLTTMTGLGGGVLLMPFLISRVRFSLHRARATSFLTTFALSTTSFFLQRHHSAHAVSWVHLAAVAVGAASGAIGVRWLSYQVPATQFDRIRKWVFTAIVGTAILSVILK